MRYDHKALARTLSNENPDTAVRIEVALREAFEDGQRDQSRDFSTTVRVDEGDYRRLLEEREHLRKQVAELQQRGTEMATERQRRTELLEKVCAMLDDIDADDAEAYAILLRRELRR